MYNITHCFLVVGAYISKKEAIGTVYERETEALSSVQKIRVKDSYEDIALDSLKERWKKRCSESHATHLAEIEETKKKVEEDKLQQDLCYELKCINTAQRHLQTEFFEQCYAEQCAHGVSNDPSSTSPFLLDEVITPLSESLCSCTPLSDIPTTHFKVQLECARRERDNALLLARQYRDMVEKT